jgi:hypothetical protein
MTFGDCEKSSEYVLLLPLLLLQLPVLDDDDDDDDKEEHCRRVQRLVPQTSSAFCVVLTRDMMMQRTGTTCTTYSISYSEFVHPCDGPSLIDQGRTLEEFSSKRYSSTIALESIPIKT